MALSKHLIEARDFNMKVLDVSHIILVLALEKQEVTAEEKEKIASKKRNKKD
jgi:hypothetical protein